VLFALCFLFLVTFLLPPSAFAATSANYEIDAMTLSGGGAASVESANYEIERGRIGLFPRTEADSTNYTAQNGDGVSLSYLIPEITAVSPGNYGKYYSDESPAYTVTAVSPDQETLSYQARMDGTVADGPQASNELSWALSAGDVGRHTLALEASDPSGSAAMARIIYVFRRPVK